jgi:hypothetical protein
VSNRVVQPINQDAANAADDALYSRHESDPRPNPLYDGEGNRQQLDPDNPDQTDLQREWIDLYAQNGGEVEATNRSQRRPDIIVEPCPIMIEFHIIDEECESVEIREPLDYRVYNESESIVQEGTWDGQATITIQGDPACRYALWIDGEYVTFHEGQQG